MAAPPSATETRPLPPGPSDGERGSRHRPKRTRQGLVLRVAKWSARNRWKAVAAWVLFVALAVVAGGAAGTRHLDGADTGAGQSGVADRALRDADFGHKPREAVLIQPRHGGLDQAETDAVVSDLRHEYAGVSGIDSVGDPVLSKDGRSRLVEVVFDTGTLTGSERNDRAGEIVGPLLDATRAVQSRHPDLRVEQVGEASIDKSFDKQIGDDLRRAELTSLPLTLAILLVAFGALIAAGVPVLLAITSVASAMGLSALASHLFPFDDTVSSVILLVGMAVGVDYSLFYIRREREERARGADRRASIEIAAATSGRAVAVSGLTVLIAMAGMFLSGSAVFIGMAIGTMLVVGVAVIGSVTVLPALLSLLGDRIERPRVPLIHRLRRRDGSSRTWGAILRVVLRRPAVSLTLAAAALLGLAVPALGMHTTLTGAADLPRSVPIMKSYDRLNAAFPNQGEAHTVVVKATSSAPLPKQEVTAAVDDLERRAAASGLFALDEKPELLFSTTGTTATVDLPIPYGAHDRRADESLDLLRDRLLPQTLDRVDGAWSGVTGEVAATRDVNHQMSSHLPLVFAFVLGLTFLVMLLTFRSVTVALTSIALNLLSVGAAYGVLVAVFQHHWAEDLLNFHSNGGIIAWLPLFLFVVLFGLSMDYHIFVVSRIREAVQAGLSTQDAVRHGVSRSASTVTSAAVIMVAVFSIFALMSLVDFKQLGVGLATAILIDATVVRGVLLPATMTVLGRRNWYLPSWLRWLPNFSHA